jgi:tRNA (cytidine/uridine-2'-O-)-methyltransferase
VLEVRLPDRGGADLEPGQFETVGHIGGGVPKAVEREGSPVRFGPMHRIPTAGLETQQQMAPGVEHALELGEDSSEMVGGREVRALTRRRRGTMMRMLEVVLVEPQIATNTGNIVRLCANVGCGLHLVRPLGFSLDDAALRRGGLDYHELIDTQVWDRWGDCRAALGGERRWFATTTRAPHRRYDDVDYRPGDVVVFGCEATGLGDAFLAEFADDRRLHIPMRPSNRSLNLANAVSVVIYEAWRQHEFDGAATGSFEESLRRKECHDPGHG